MLNDNRRCEGDSVTNSKKTNMAVASFCFLLSFVLSLFDVSDLIYFILCFVLPWPQAFLKGAFLYCKK